MRGGETLLRTRRMVASRSVYGKGLQRQLHSAPIAGLRKRPHRKIHQLIDAVIHIYASVSPSHKRFLEGCHPSCHPPNTSRRFARGAMILSAPPAPPPVLSRVHFTLNATCPTPQGASSLMQALSAWSAKARRVPSRHCRDARVYGLTTTAMHDNEYPPRPVQ